MFISHVAKHHPTNPKLWRKVQKLVRGDVAYIKVGDTIVNGPRGGKGFKKHPSAYSNGWAVKKYKALGGKWKTAMDLNRIASRVADLKQWFSKKHPKGDWVAINTQGEIVGPCAQSDKRGKETKEGQDPIKCLPRAKAERMDPKDRASAARRKKLEERTSPNTKKPVHAPTKAKGS